MEHKIWISGGLELEAIHVKFKIFGTYIINFVVFWNANFKVLLNVKLGFLGIKFEFIIVV